MLRGLIDRPDLRAELSARAMARAEALSPERMAAGYLAIYRDLLAGRARSREGTCAS